MLLDGDKPPGPPVLLTHDELGHRMALIIVALSAMVAIGLYWIFPSIFSRHFPGFRIHNTPAESMAPALGPGDHVFVNYLVYDISEPKRGDVVVAEVKEGGKPIQMFKRIVAIGGDEISVSRTKTFLNSRLLDEPYVNRNGGSVTPETSVDPEDAFRDFKIPRITFFCWATIEMKATTAATSGR